MPFMRSINAIESNSTNLPQTEIVADTGTANGDIRRVIINVIAIMRFLCAACQDLL